MRQALEDVELTKSYKERLERTLNSLNGSSRLRFGKTSSFFEELAKEEAERNGEVEETEQTEQNGEQNSNETNNPPSHRAAKTNAQRRIAFRSKTKPSPSRPPLKTRNPSKSFKNFPRISSRKSKSVYSKIPTNCSRISKN